MGKTTTTLNVTSGKQNPTIAVSSATMRASEQVCGFVELGLDNAKVSV